MNYILFQTGQLVHTPARRANIQALRSSIIMSLSDDGKISFIEFLKRYPTNDLTVDGFQVARTTTRVTQFINQAKKDFKVPIAIATDLIETFVCDCEAGPSSPTASPSSTVSP
ncbi:MAG: alpha/beta hydrolase [Thermosynechococcaceae cyanobacterium]